MFFFFTVFKRMVNLFNPSISPDAQTSLSLKPLGLMHRDTQGQTRDITLPHPPIKHLSR